MNKELTSKTETYLVVDQKEKSDIVIGAPHHAPGGVDWLPCTPRRPADENTGFIAKAIADILSGNIVIACNATSDPNKKMDTGYSKQIISWAPKFLIEIHGHGGGKVKREIIEVSSGSKSRNIYSETFSNILQSKLDQSKSIIGYKVKGDFSSLVYQATGSATIIDNRWIPIHIELPPDLRKDKNNDLPTNWKDLVQILSETIQEFTNNADFNKAVEQIGNT